MKYRTTITVKKGDEVLYTIEGDRKELDLNEITPYVIQTEYILEKLTGFRHHINVISEDRKISISGMDHLLEKERESRGSR